MGKKIANMGQGNIGAFTNPNENVLPDAKSRALWRTMLIKDLDTGRCTSAQELSDRFEKLFTMCFNNNFIPTVEALALCSGMDRRTIHDIEIGNTHKGDGMSDVIKKAKDFIATVEAELARDGEINSTVYIFRAKNYFGMSDKQEIEVKPVIGNDIPENTEDIINSIPKLKSSED